MEHRVQTDLQNALMTSTVNAFLTPEGLILGAGTTVGNGIEGWAPGAIFVDTDAAAGATLWVNEGTKTTATWAKVGAQPITLADSEALVFGTGSDIQIEWDGSKLTSGPATGMWADCPSPIDPNPNVAYTFHDDFIAPTTGAALAAEWVEATVGTGTQAVGDVDAGGVYVMTCQATTDNACEQATLADASFKLAAGKTLWYETRFKQVGDSQSELSFGLCNLGEDLTAVADVLPQDGVSFSHQDASLAMALTCSKNGTDTGAVAGVQTIVSGTWYTFGLLIDGVTSVTPYINGVAGTAATATICDDELLAPYFLIRNGDATTQQVLHVDYVKVVQLR